MSGSRPVRALVLVLTGYAMVRTLVVFAPGLWRPAIPADARRLATGSHPATAVTTRSAEVPVRPTTMGTMSLPPAWTIVRTGAPPVVAAPTIPTRRTRGDTSVPDDAGGSPASLATATPMVASAIAAVDNPAAGTTSDPSSRWSGFAYVFHRAGGGGALAPGGQIGGSQIAARIARRIDDRVALAARIAMPTAAPEQAEVAAGVDVTPMRGLRLSLERRVALGRQGRDAWSAYAAGGFYRAVSPHLALDGYAQAGIVGARRRDPFADGAMRLARRMPLSPRADLQLGAGVWGAVQPGAARLDVGPRAALATRVARLPVTLALEGRFRIAGRARPGDGAALTLATDF